MQQPIDDLARQIREQERFPAVGISVGHQDNPVQLAVNGVRQHKSTVPIQLADKWHIGSITKSITATMIGRLVEDGVLAFDTPMIDLLPHISMHSQWAECSLEHLLTHTSGLPANFPTKAQKINAANSTDLVLARRDLIQEALTKAPKTPSGSKFVYSNLGYAVIGHVIETLTDSCYEDFVGEYFFKPNGLSSAGFGPPLGEQPDDQPMGHRDLLWYRKSANPFEERADNSAVISAAGRAHMNLKDLVAYGRMHLDGERGTGHFLKTDTWKRLHTPVTDDYAYGWAVSQSAGCAGPVIWHNGSNTLWYALLMLNPDKNTVLAFVTNTGAIRKADRVFTQAAEHITDQLE